MLSEACKDSLWLTTAKIGALTDLVLMVKA